jgi:hypothetical protein
MDSRPRRIAPAWPLLAGWLACALLGAGEPARAQTPPPTSTTGQDQPQGRTEKPPADTKAVDQAGTGTKPAEGRTKANAKSKPNAKEKANAKEADPAKVKAARREPSAEFQESIRKTIEKRRQRRARQAQGADDLRPVGAIVPWPMPPALIIRQTAPVHDEVDSLLGQLRRGGG